eukprot:g22393.t1
MRMFWPISWCLFSECAYREKGKGKKKSCRRNSESCGASDNTLNFLGKRTPIVFDRSPDNPPEPNQTSRTPRSKRSINKPTRGLERIEVFSSTGTWQICFSGRGERPSRNFCGPGIFPCFVVEKTGRAPHSVMFLILCAWINEVGKFA